MIAVLDKDFTIFLLHKGYRLIDYRSIGKFNGKDDMAYIFNDRNRISLLKDLYESGSLDIYDRLIYYKKIAGQQQMLSEMKKTN